MKPGNNLMEYVLNFPCKGHYFNSAEGLRNTKLNVDRYDWESKDRRCLGLEEVKFTQGTASVGVFLSVLQSHTKTNLWFTHFSSLGGIFKKNHFPSSTSNWKSKGICCSFLYHQTLLQWTHFEHFSTYVMPYLE